MLVFVDLSAAGDQDGEMNLHELYRLIRDLGLSLVSNADILYFMVRTFLECMSKYDCFLLNKS